MNIEEEIKTWVNLDNQLKAYNSKIKELRLERTNLSDKITSYIENTNIREVEITDGVLRFQNVKSTPPLTFGFIQKCLTDVIPDEEKVEQIINYIKEKRDIKVSADIKRIYR